MKLVLDIGKKMNPNDRRMIPVTPPSLPRRANRSNIFRLWTYSSAARYIIDWPIKFSFYSKMVGIL